MSYEPLSTSSHHQSLDSDEKSGSGGSLAGVGGASKDDSSADGVTLFVMHKEKRVAVRMPSLGCTLLEFKQKIESKCQVPEPQQRLIRNGKMLRALQKTLSELELEDESTIHLFPIPQAVASPVGSSSSGPGTATQATNVQGMAAPGGTHPGALHANHDENMHPLTIVRGETPHLNPWFQNTCREVQMWSMILMVLSLLTLTNNLSVFMGTGEYGDSALDKAVFILDTLVSAGGLYVGRIGMVASRTLETEDVKKYVVYLAGLCVFAIVMRIMWVFDVVEEITKAVHKAEADAPVTDGSGGDSSGDDTAATDDPSASPQPPISDDMITTVTMQATIISLIIIFAWTSCLIRAVRLRWALRLYERANSRGDADLEESGQIEGVIVVNPVQQGRQATAVPVPA